MVLFSLGLVSSLFFMSGKDLFSDFDSFKIGKEILCLPSLSESLTITNFFALKRLETSRLFNNSLAISMHTAQFSFSQFPCPLFLMVHSLQSEIPIFSMYSKGKYVRFPHFSQSISSTSMIFIVLIFFVVSSIESSLTFFSLFPRTGDVFLGVSSSSASSGSEENSKFPALGLRYKFLFSGVSTSSNTVSSSTFH